MIQQTSVVFDLSSVGSFLFTQPPFWILLVLLTASCAVADRLFLKPFERMIYNLTLGEERSQQQRRTQREVEGEGDGGGTGGGGGENEGAGISMTVMHEKHSAGKYRLSSRVDPEDDGDRGQYFKCVGIVLSSLFTIKSKMAPAPTTAAVLKPTRAVKLVVGGTKKVAVAAASPPSASSAPPPTTDSSQQDAQQQQGADSDGEAEPAVVGGVNTPPQTRRENSSRRLISSRGRRKPIARFGSMGNFCYIDNDNKRHCLTLFLAKSLPITLSGLLLPLPLASILSTSFCRRRALLVSTLP